MDVQPVQRLSRSNGPQSRAAQEVVAHALRGKFLYVPGLGWLGWDGKRWSEGPAVEDQAREEVRSFADLVQHRWQRQAEQTWESYHALVAKHFVDLDGVTLAAALRHARDPKTVRGLTPRLSAPDRETLEKLEVEGKSLDTQASIWLNLLSLAAVNAMLKLASGMAGVFARHEQLDADPDILNVDNGVVDLATGQLKPHDPALLLTKVCKGGYRPGATCPWWTRALEVVHPGLEDWLQLRIGQSATGHTPDDDVLFMCAGTGENGKTTVINGIKHALGGYAGLAPAKSLMGRPDDHSTEKTFFRGLRMALMEETPVDGHLDMHAVKSTVGTPEITARKMHQNDVTFSATHTMWITTNYLPRVSGADRGTWRRLVSVPWPYTFMKEGEVPRTLFHVPGDRRVKLNVVNSPSQQTLDAMITWVVNGAMAWYARDRVSPPHPDAILEASGKWRAQADPALQFVRDYLMPSDDHVITAEDMRDTFSAFLDSQRVPTWSSQTMNTRLPEACMEERIFLTANPLKPARIRNEDIVSRPDRWFGGATGIQPGTLGRYWRGVRFRLPADKIEDEASL